MANKLMRFDPFSDIARFDSLRGIEDFFRNFHSRSILGDVVAEPGIKMDVKETEQGYTIKADLPGVKKEDIRIDIAGNRVSISAEVKREKEEKEGEYVRSERYYGQQSRIFTLGQELNDAETTASYQDGVLELSVPKKAGNGGSKITVS
jgi:HSP20 family protein